LYIIKLRIVICRYRVCTIRYGGNGAILELIVRCTFAIVKDHKVIMVHFISYDLSPSLLDHVNDLILPCQVKTGRWEAIDMGRVLVNGSRGPVITESTRLGISHGPEYHGLRTFGVEKPVDSTFKQSVAFWPRKGDTAVDNT
jgi:hypothetical protein